MIRLINDDASNHGSSYNMVFTDPPFEMNGKQLHDLLNLYDFEHLVLIASMHQIIDFVKHSDLEFAFDLVVSHITPKKSRNYSQPNYLHSNIAYFKKSGVKSAFDRRRIERQDHYSDVKSNYYPTIFHAPKQDLQYKYQKNQSMIDDLLGAFDVKSICDPFAGSGTTGFAALEHGMDCTLIEKDIDAFAILKTNFKMLGVANVSIFERW